MKRTFQPIAAAAEDACFLERIEHKNGRLVLKRRRAKGRNV